VSATPDIIAQVRAAGGRVMIIEDRLKVRATLPLPDKLVAELRLHKAEVMAFLQDRKLRGRRRTGGCSTTSGRALPSTTADCRVSTRSGRHSSAALSNGSGGIRRRLQGRSGAPIAASPWGEPGRDSLPFLTGAGDHTWLHSGCHGDWTVRCQARAAAALAILGLRPRTGTS